MEIFFLIPRNPALRGREVADSKTAGTKQPVPLNRVTASPRCVIGRAPGRHEAPTRHQKWKVLEQPPAASLETRRVALTVIPLSEESRLGNSICRSEVCMCKPTWTAPWSPAPGPDPGTRSPHTLPSLKPDAQLLGLGWCVLPVLAASLIADSPSAPAPACSSPGSSGASDPRGNVC